MKQIFICLFSLLLFSNNFSQSADATKWVNYIDSDSSLSFKYPSYFEIDREIEAYNTYNGCKQRVNLSYMSYEPIDPNIKSDSLEYPSDLTILLCDKKFSQVAGEFGFYEKDGFWYGDSSFIPTNDNNYAFESYAAYAINFGDWFGVKATSPTSIYIKGGGAWTKAGDYYRFLLYKEITKNKFIFVEGDGFSFPHADEILTEICKSIKIINK